jgi:fatty acid desaturase
MTPAPSGASSASAYRAGAENPKPYQPKLWAEAHRRAARRHRRNRRIAAAKTAAAVLVAFAWGAFLAGAWFVVVTGERL